METNNSFSFQRLMLLGKQSLIINKKLIGISLAGFAGTLFMLLVFFQYKSHFSNWGNSGYMLIFTFLFFVLGMIYSSLSFPAFRSKEKSMTFLMLPASATEKFVFELLSRIVVFIFIMPVAFWVVANLEGALVHSFFPELINYKFSFGKAYSEITAQGVEGWLKFLFIQGILFVFIASFTGASHFSKSPLLKTMFTFSIIVAGYAFFSYLLFKGLNIRDYNAGKNIFFMDKDDSIVFGAIAITLINLSLLSISWFKLKEKEA